MEDKEFKCMFCPNSVIGDPKYHEVYENGKRIGFRHRRCGGNVN